MVHSLLNSPFRQRRVYRLRPALPPPLQYRGPVPLRGLLSEDLPLQPPHREHDVSVRVPPVIMQSCVCHHPPRHTRLVQPAFKKTHLVRQAELLRQRQLELPGELRVLPPLCRLDHIPEPLSVVDPGRRPLGSQDAGVRHRLPLGVVPCLAQPLIEKRLARPVGRRRHGRLPRASADDLGAQTINGHGVTPGGRLGVQGRSP